MAIDFIAPFATHGFFKIFHNCLPFKKSFWREQLLKLPVGLIKNNINNAGRGTFYRHQVIQADNGIKNDITSLNAFKNLLIEAKDKYEKNSRNSYSHLSEEQYKFIFTYYLQYSQTHHSVEKRIAKIDAQIDGLQQQEWEKYVQNLGKDNSFSQTNKDLTDLFKKN